MYVWLLCIVKVCLTVFFPILQDFCVQAIMCFLILISMIVAAAYAPYSSAAVAAAVSLPLHSYASAIVCSYNVD